MAKAKPEWIPVAEAAQVSGYNVEHIRRLIRSKRVTGKKFATVWMLNQDSWGSYLEQVGKLGKKRGPRSEGT